MNLSLNRDKNSHLYATIDGKRITSELYFEDEVIDIYVSILMQELALPNGECQTHAQTV